MAVALHIRHFRFGIDQLAENTHGWYGNEDASIYLPVDTTFLLRYSVWEEGGSAAANTDFQFQYKLNDGSWVNVTASSPVVKAVAATALTNNGDCTQRLTGQGTFESSGAGQTEDGLSGGNANDIAANGCSETECGLQIVGSAVSRGDVISFQLTSPDFGMTVDVTATATVKGNVILTASPGAFACSGTAAALTCDRKMSAATGSFSWSGTDATLTVEEAPLINYTLTADPGSFAIVGTAATLRRGLKLAASAGSYGMVGTASRVLYGRKLVASAGTFPDTGTAARLLVARRLVANTGSSAWTGTAARLLHARKLAATSGIFAWTGSTAELVYTPAAGDYQLAADGGTFGFSGTEARLLVSHKLAAASGAYSWSGSAATFPWNRHLNANAGSFAWNGGTAALTITVPAAPTPERLLISSGDGLAWTITSGTKTTHRVTDSPRTGITSSDRKA